MVGQYGRLLLMQLVDHRQYSARRIVAASTQIFGVRRVLLFITVFFVMAIAAVRTTVYLCRRHETVGARTRLAGFSIGRRRIGGRGQQRHGVTGEATSCG